MTPEQFVQKWTNTELTERAASHEHFVQNERPTWLKLAHEKLDRGVLAAYAATDPQGHWCEDWAAVFTETGPGQPLPPNHPLTQQRAEVEKKILENLLRLNHERAGTQE